MNGFYWKKIITSKYFSINVEQFEPHTDIVMEVYGGITTTKDLPSTIKVLKKNIFSIFNSTCFNDGDIPFVLEVRRTEVGHLFEHILLEYLCKLKIANGSKEAEFEGVTSWNWKKYPKGSFHIHIDAGWEDNYILPTALNKSVKIITEIFESSIKNKDLNFALFSQSNSQGSY